MPDLGHKRVSDHQDLKDMEVLKTCEERNGGPERVGKKDREVLRELLRKEKEDLMDR